MSTTGNPSDAAFGLFIGVSPPDLDASAYDLGGTVGAFFGLLDIPDEIGDGCFFLDRKLGWHF